MTNMTEVNRIFVNAYNLRQLSLLLGWCRLCQTSSYPIAIEIKNAADLPQHL